MEKLQEAELQDVVNILYRYITHDTQIFETMSQGKYIFRGTNYIADLKSLLNKAKICYEHPGSDGFLSNSNPISINSFKFRVFCSLEEKFVKEFKKVVKGTESQFRNLFRKSFFILAIKQDLRCTNIVSELFGLDFMAKAKTLDIGQEKKVVNEAFDRIYKQFN